MLSVPQLIQRHLKKWIDVADGRLNVDGFFKAVTTGVMTNILYGENENKKDENEKDESLP